ncbi:glycoside hydrolase superfamily [Geopyxis carbonaria]|nr:glycoside hydrolase superfamily [Geopyxis carbonaria]
MVPVPTSTGTPSTGGGKVVTYFGQRGNADELSLSDLCKDPSVDIVALGFVNMWASTKGDKLPGTNFAGFQGAEPFPNTDIYQPAGWDTQIPECQAAGKKILISIGGAVMHDGLESVEMATKFAENIWNMFGEGQDLKEFRPFGAAVVDGFDFDIENKKPAYVPEAMDALRKLYQGASKEFVITAAPQCPRMDPVEGTIDGITGDQSLQKAVYHVDYLFIQFYNNEVCHLDNTVGSFGEWSADIKSQNPNAKIFAGFPGDSTEQSAGSGYASPDQVRQYTAEMMKSDNFGGLMSWEAVGSLANKEANGDNFLATMKKAMA